MFYTICYHFLFFFGVSVLGWLVETTYCSIRARKLNLNRGFLIGPYIPLYGCGGLLCLWFLNRYYSDPLVVFILAFVGFSSLEYFTSYLMEKLFNARWWDYSNIKYNINGRIVLSNSFLFGIMGLLFIYLVNPFYSSLLEGIPEGVLEIISVLCFLVFLTDFIVSFVIIYRLKSTTRKLKDSTNEISEQVKEELQKNSFLKKRLLDAFPKLQTHYGDKIIDYLRKSIDGGKQGLARSKEKLKGAAKRKKK